MVAVAPLVVAGARSDRPQTPGPPGSATTSAPPKATAVILGQVTDGSTGQPIAEAVVLLRPVSPGARGGAGFDAASAAALASAMAGDAGANAAMAAAMAAMGARGGGAAAS